MKKVKFHITDKAHKKLEEFANATGDSLQRTIIKVFDTGLEEMKKEMDAPNQYWFNFED